MKNQIERFLRRKSVRKVLGDRYVLSERQRERLLLILDTPRRVKELEDWLPTFAHFVRCDLTNYIGRFRRLRMLPASPSLYSLLLRYGKREAIVRHQDRKRKAMANFANTTVYWIERGYSPDEAMNRAKEVQATRIGLGVHVIRGTSEHTVRSVAYWLKQGYSLEQAKEKVRRVQATNGIEAYRRRGCADPAHAQRQRTEKWLATLRAKEESEQLRIKLARSHSIEGHMARGLDQSSAEAASIAYFSKRRNFSVISQKCFDMVRDRLGKDGLYYKTFNYERQFHGKCVDFFDRNSGTVIEFLGDYWHANPLFYLNEQPIYKRLACDIRLDDRRRFALIAGHHLVAALHIVWESEFRKNPTEVVECIVSYLLDARGCHV